MKKIYLPLFLAVVVGVGFGLVPKVQAATNFIRPISGETLEVGKTYPISWYGIGTPNTEWRLFYSAVGGSKVEIITKGTKDFRYDNAIFSGGGTQYTANMYYDWLVPQLAPGSYKLIKELRAYGVLESTDESAVFNIGGTGNQGQSTKFIIGDRVITNIGSVRVRGIFGQIILTLPALRFQGTVVGGPKLIVPPSVSSPTWFWEINFDDPNASDGYVAEQLLDKIPPPSTTFAIGDRVRENAGGTVVRVSPDTYAAKIATVRGFDQGVIVGGPVYGVYPNGNYVWRWKVSWEGRQYGDSKFEGWSPEELLIKEVNSKYYSATCNKFLQDGQTRESFIVKGSLSGGAHGVATVNFWPMMPPPPVIAPSSPFGSFIPFGPTPLPFNNNFIGFEQAGATGVVYGGPTYMQGNCWWKTYFLNKSPQGWMVDSELTKSVTAPPTVTSTKPIAKFKTGDVVKMIAVGAVRSSPSIVNPFNCGEPGGGSCDSNVVRQVTAGTRGTVKYDPYYNPDRNRYFYYIEFNDGGANGYVEEFYLDFYAPPIEVSCAGVNFINGDRIKVKNSAGAAVQSDDPTLPWSLGGKPPTRRGLNIIGSQPFGALGAVMGSPISTSDYCAVKVNFDSGTDGWVSSDDIEKFTTTTLKFSIGDRIITTKLTDLFNDSGAPFNLFYGSAQDEARQGMITAGPKIINSKTFWKVDFDFKSDPGVAAPQGIVYDGWVEESSIKKFVASDYPLRGAGFISPIQGDQWLNSNTNKWYTISTGDQATTAGSFWKGVYGYGDTNIYLRKIGDVNSETLFKDGTGWVVKDGVMSNSWRPYLYPVGSYQFVLKDSHEGWVYRTSESGIFSIVTSNIPITPTSTMGGVIIASDSFTSPTTIGVGVSGQWRIKATDQNGYDLTYRVVWGDGRYDTNTLMSGSTVVVRHAFLNTGNYTATLSVTDRNNITVSKSLTITVDNNGTGNTNQPPVISRVNGPTTLITGQSGTWTVQASDPENGMLSYSVQWGDGQKIAPTQSQTALGGSQPATFSHVYQSTGTYTIVITVTDNGGFSTTTSLAVVVSNIVLNPTSSKFRIGDRVEVTADLRARSNPTMSGSIAGVQVAGSLGTVTGGSVWADNYFWWEINYDNGADGWSVEDYLKLATGVNPPLDNIVPTVTILSPVSNSTVTGASVSLSASASDNVGVAGVQFKLDDQNLGAEDVTSPYSIAWNTAQTTNGSHILTAVARDAAGNLGTSQAISVVVSNTATNPVSSKFNIGDRVEVTTDLRARLTPDLTGNISGVQTVRSLGTITRGSVWADNYFWWEINYDNGADGWSVEDYLKLATGVNPPPVNNPPTITADSFVSPTNVTVGTNNWWRLQASDSDSPGPLGYSISWGDGGTDNFSIGNGELKQAFHTYNIAGTYTVVFTATDSLGASKTKSLTVVVAGTGTGNTGEPIVINPSSFTSPTSVKAGEENWWLVQAVNPNHNGASLRVDIVWGDGSQSGYGNMFTWIIGSGQGLRAYHTYGTPGTYTAKLKLTEEIIGSSQIPKATISKDLQITVLPSGQGSLAPLIPDFTFLGPTYVKSGALNSWKIQAQVKVSASMLYSINWGDGTSSGQSLNSNQEIVVYHTYNQNGNFTALLTVTDALGGKSTKSLGVAVVAPSVAQNQAPEIIKFSGPTDVKVGVWNWWDWLAIDPESGALFPANGVNNFSASVDWGDGKTSSCNGCRNDILHISFFSHAYEQAGNYNMILTISDGKGGTVTKSTPIVVSASAAQ
ncbi:MAG: PKD domain-containing protein [Candidatus Paceibacterota bacterium]|jgi:hypothetical protein